MPPDEQTAAAAGQSRAKLALRTWLEILACRKQIDGQLRRRLRDRYQSTLPRFDVAAALYRHPDGLTMGEVARHLMVTKGNITAIAAPLEAEGIIERERSGRDRRSQIVRLTKQGRRSFAARAKVHEGWIEELFSGLTTDEIATLDRLLNKLNAPLKDSAGPPAPLSV